MFSESAESPVHAETPYRLREVLKLAVEFASKGLKIKGAEKLKDLPKGQKVIIATTHISDLDVAAVAYAFGRWNIAIVDQSTHHDPNQDRPSFMLNLIAGRENFLPISASWNKKATGKFDPRDYKDIIEAMDKGKTIIFAAHNPTVEGKLPSSPGDGVTYLAQLTGATIVPVAVDVPSEEPIVFTGEGVKGVIGFARKIIKYRTSNRPPIALSIGEPLVLDKLPIDVIGKVMQSERSSISHEDRVEFRRVRRGLKEQSQRVMRSLASMLPKEKQGAWAPKQPQPAV